MRRLLILLGLLGVIGAGTVAFMDRTWMAPGPSPRETAILIAPRTGGGEIARQLQAAGLLKNAFLYEAELHLQGRAGKVKAGEYAIPPRASMAEITAIMVLGKSIQHKITIAEGLTSAMVRKLVQDDPLLAGSAGPVPAEGALLPETYLFTRGTTRADLIARMERAQARFFSRAWGHRDAGLPFASPEQAVIMASIVEKESALPEERRHIAAVFDNRLRQGMKLQSDPTIIYGVTGGYPLGRPIRENEITAQTPYNTYVIPGLPPAPICNPSKDSLEAVLNPLASPDLYFVANGKGGHSFAATEAEHDRDVKVYRSFLRKENPPPPSPKESEARPRHPPPR
ncbi:MAG: endolytic transglycosylase MltG [Rhizomicrobium sp.]